MNFTDFLYDVFTLKSYETKSYAGRNREGEGGGKKEGREWELVESLNKTPATHRRKKKKKKHQEMEYYQEPDPETVRGHLWRLALAWKRTSEQDRHCPL